MSTSPKGESNQRNYARVKIEAHATLYLSKNIKKGLRVRNISPKGIGGLIDFPLKLGQKVEVMLLYPFFEEPVKKEASVARCEQVDQNTWHVGLDLNKDNELDLTRYLKLRYQLFTS